MSETVTEPLVRVEHLTRTFITSGGEVHALNDINLDVPRGRLIALKGKSGSGKTTLLNLVGGLDRPTSGELYFDGQMLSAMDDAALTQLRRERIGFVFQSFALLPTYSAFENVEFALRLSGGSVEDNRSMPCMFESRRVGKPPAIRPDNFPAANQQRVHRAPMAIIPRDWQTSLLASWTRQIRNRFCAYSAKWLI